MKNCSRGRILTLAAAIFACGVLVHLYDSSVMKRVMARVGTPQEASEKKGNEDPKPTPQKRPKIKLPVVTDVLQKPKFASSWKEDPDLATVRKFGVVENIPDVDVLNTYDVNKLSAIYHSFLDNDDILCHRKLRMGQVGDGGWEICDDYEWRPIRPCIIYSFGINYDFSFDDDAGKLYGCDVYSFDPSMKKQPTYQRSGTVMFYQLGLGGQSGPAQKQGNGWVLHSLSNFRTMLNHTDKVIDVIKMDVEGAEWTALPTMIKEGQLSNVRQLLVEYHHSSDDLASLRPRLKIISDVEREGFKRFYVHKNFYCKRKAVGIPIPRTACYEIHYVNSNFRREK